MKSILKKVLFVVLILLIGIDLNLYTKEIFDLRVKCETEKKYDMILKWSEQLEQKGLISISSQEFAKAATIVMWCESNLKTTSKDKLNAQGLFQIMPKTRRYLNLPEDIRDLSFEQQLEIYEMFLVKSGHLYKVQNSVDLHVIGFAPSKFSKKVFYPKKVNPYLDYDGDGVLTRNDLKLFQNKRVESNTFVKNL